MRSRYWTIIKRYVTMLWTVKGHCQRLKTSKPHSMQPYVARTLFCLLIHSLLIGSRLKEPGAYWEFGRRRSLTSGNPQPVQVPEIILLGAHSDDHKHLSDE